MYVKTVLFVYSNVFMLTSPHIRHTYFTHICDRLWENRAQRGMRRCRKKIDLVLKIVLNKPNEGNG